SSRLDFRFQRRRAWRGISHRFAQAPIRRCHQSQGRLRLTRSRVRPSLRLGLGLDFVAQSLLTLLLGFSWALWHRHSCLCVWGLSWLCRVRLPRRTALGFLLFL